MLFVSSTAIQLAVLGSFQHVSPIINPFPLLPATCTLLTGILGRADRMSHCVRRCRQALSSIACNVTSRPWWRGSSAGLIATAGFASLPPPPPPPPVHSKVSLCSRPSREGAATDPTHTDPTRTDPTHYHSSTVESSSSSLISSEIILIDRESCFTTRWVSAVTSGLACPPPYALPPLAWPLQPALLMLLALLMEEIEPQLSWRASATPPSNPSGVEAISSCS